ncbi:hypothetical protein T492DRAFT_592434 [Pavlovales sp. CCMP2436]|nr:hypothetical protein T492DRAFT_592434 [Pavlovales sp. CCMP2436]
MWGARRHSARPGWWPAIAALLLVAFVVLARQRNSDRAVRGGCSVDGLDRLLEELTLSNCGLSRLPAGIIEFTNLRKLDASGNELCALPPLPPSLRMLFLSNNRFTELPQQLRALSQLRMLAFRGNLLQGTLASSVLPPSLEWLILTENRIEGLPADLGEAGGSRCALIKLMLANNQVAALPPSMAACARLELVRLSNNRLEQIPPWLLELPRLAWLALAGNPALFPAALRTGSAALPSFNQAELGVDPSARPLGAGTSGVVHVGHMPGGNSAPVAVKLFKAPHTSDGTTADEVCASEAASAGAPAGLVRALALVRPADGADLAAPAGIVLEWLQGYSSLGQPPSLLTCSRDTYAADARFSLQGALRTLSAVCGGLLHLHGMQIAHGDVYAHNILVKPSGEAKLSDFGAAFGYSSARGALPAQLERLEMRAFGLLISELAERLDEVVPSWADKGLRGRERQTRLRKLASRAANKVPSERPLFASVCAELAQMEAAVGASAEEHHR